MAKVQIKHRWNGSVLFEADIPDETPSGMHMRVALEKATAARANLTDANLADAYLAGAYLAGANLTDANLARAYLAGANLADANLTDANLTDANLARANLTDAYLADANLADAYLAGANLAGAKWRDGIVINKQPIKIYGLQWTVTILDAHMQIGCQLHSLAEWAAFDDAQIVEMDGRDALRFWRANKEPLLALARASERSFESVTEAVEA